MRLWHWLTLVAPGKQRHLARSHRHRPSVGGDNCISELCPLSDINRMQLRAKWRHT